MKPFANSKNLSNYKNRHERDIGFKMQNTTLPLHPSTWKNWVCRVMQKEYTKLRRSNSRYLSLWPFIAMEPIAKKNQMFHTLCRMSLTFLFIHLFCRIQVSKNPASIINVQARLSVFYSFTLKRLDGMNAIVFNYIPWGNTKATYIIITPRVKPWAAASCS